MNKTISIALATYNGETFLKQQLNSIYDQTYSKIEVVVSDDKSTDGTVAILEEYKYNYGLQYTVNDINIGFVKNFENALRMCKGDYIALCDQDDIWFPDKIETLAREINNQSMICSDAIIINKHGEVLSDSMYHYSNRKFFYKKQFSHLLYENYVTGCTILFKRELLERALPFPDWIKYHDWWLSVVASCMNGISFIQKPLIKYRYHGNNQTETVNKYKNMPIIYKLKEYLNKKETGFFEKEIKWLSLLDKELIISGNNKKILNERILFYKDIRDSLIHFKAAYIAYKQRDVMLSGRSFVGRIFFIISTLFAR